MPTFNPNPLSDMILATLKESSGIPLQRQIYRQKPFSALTGYSSDGGYHETGDVALIEEPWNWSTAFIWKRQV